MALTELLSPLTRRGNAIRNYSPRNINASQFWSHCLPRARGLRGIVSVHDRREPEGCRFNRQPAVSSTCLSSRAVTRSSQCCLVGWKAELRRSTLIPRCDKNTKNQHEMSFTSTVAKAARRCLSRPAKQRASSTTGVLRLGQASALYLDRMTRIVTTRHSSVGGCEAANSISRRTSHGGTGVLPGRFRTFTKI